MRRRRWLEVRNGREATGSVVANGFLGHGVGLLSYLLGASGLDQSPVPLGQARVSAQPTGTIQGQAITLQPGPSGGETTYTGSTAVANPAKQARRKAIAAAVDQAYGARTAALPASDPRITPKPAPRLSTAKIEAALDLTSGLDPGPSADSTPAIFRTTEIDPPNGTTGVAGSPAVAQNGRHVLRRGILPRPGPRMAARRSRWSTLKPTAPG